MLFSAAACAWTTWDLNLEWNEVKLGMAREIPFWKITDFDEPMEDLMDGAHAAVSWKDGLASELITGEWLRRDIADKGM